MTIAPTGVTMNALTVSGAKSFRITHPRDETKYLTHSCLEGPENGVYYRGEGMTTDSWAEITLPDYFEALTLKEGRTVYLTPLFEDDAEIIGTVAASRVVDGRFRVWSAVPSQKFYWEVMAVRGDVPELQVVQDRIPDPPSTFDQPIQQPEMPDEQASTDAQASRRTTNGSGAPEDGKLHSQAPSHAAAVAGRASRTRHAHRAN
jgi:hypothetical protein